MVAKKIEMDQPMETLSPMARLLEERRLARAMNAAKTLSGNQQEAISALHRRLRLPPGYHLADDGLRPASQGERDMIAAELVRVGIIDADALSSKDALIEQVLERMRRRMVEGLPPVDWGGHRKKQGEKRGEL